MDMLVTTGQYSPELFPNESESMATHYLFDKLTRHFALVESDSILQEFYTQYYNTVIRGQVELHIGMEEMEQIMQSYYLMLDSVNASIQIV